MLSRLNHLSQLLPALSTWRGAAAANARGHATVSEPEPEPVTHHTQFSVFKTKGAVRFKALPVRWTTTDKGHTVIDHPGCMLAEFAPAAAGPDKAGNRTYNWADQKISIALSVQELAAMILSKQEGKVELFHDPGMVGQGRIVHASEMVGLRIFHVLLCFLAAAEVMNGCGRGLGTGP